MLQDKLYIDFLIKYFLINLEILQNNFLNYIL